MAKVRNTFRLEKVGHCGTLDPMATGLLILVLGKATKLSERFMSVPDKIYEGTLRLGETTDSYDADGEVTSGESDSVDVRGRAQREREVLSGGSAADPADGQRHQSRRQAAVQAWRGRARTSRANHAWCTSTPTSSANTRSPSLISG